jgi:hypothetical protein
MMRRTIVSAALMAAAFVMQAETAQACACCTEPGQRFESNGPIDAYIAAELARIRFAPTAVLYSDAGFPDSIQGFANPSTDPYAVRASIGNGVNFDFRDASGRVSRLQFPFSRTMARFEVDPRSTVGHAPPNGPSLYKEWRLSGPARVGGAVLNPRATAVATLILHGGGNSCSSAADFKGWTLSVKGPGVAFTFLGELVS